MKIIPKNILHKSLLPVPIYTSVYVGEAISKEGEDFNVFIGLEEKYIAQLRNLSLNLDDTDLQKNTGDYKRFGIGSYEEWYNKNRTPFCLIHTRTDSLAALVWFGPEPIPKKSELEEGNKALENWHTIAFRSYPPFRGRGLMKKFSSFVMDVYKRNFGSINFWIVTNIENKGEIALAECLGLETSEEYLDIVPGRVIMIKKQK